VKPQSSPTPASRSSSATRSSVSDALVIAATAAIVLGLDQFAKRWIVAHFMPGESSIIIPHLLKWTYEQNTRGAFGLFSSNTILLIAMAVLVLVIFWFLFRESARTSIAIRIAFGAIVGGAIGNIVDRVHYGFVVDFIDFYRIWPNIFNVGDACITLGVIALILSGSIKTRSAKTPS
jgi:signal peptidase II